MPRNEFANQSKWDCEEPVPGRPQKNGDADPFWMAKTLEEMSPEEWEALCDGCGQCCLIKLEDEETGDIAVTRLSCKLLDPGSCRCSDYANRQKHVPDCVKLTPEAARNLPWLPETCAYRLIANGRNLYWWHPLVSGTAESVHWAGVSVRAAALSETKVPEARFPAYIVDWIKVRGR